MVIIYLVTKAMDALEDLPILEDPPTIEDPCWVNGAIDILEDPCEKTNFLKIISASYYVFYYLSVQ